jgi:spore coat protein CotH
VIRKSRSARRVSSARSAPQPSLKIAVDAVDPDRTSGLEKITLNNSIQDPSYIDQCIGYALFDRAGLPAPRCNFAHLTVNGQPLGTYVHVEAIEDELLDHHYLSSDGNLYEGTLSDFLPAWAGTFEKENNVEEDDWSDIEAVVTAAAAPDAELLTSLDAVIDTDEFIRFWALESLVQHWDGYAGNINNFWLYESGGRLHFPPWGADQLLAERNPVQGDDAPARSTPLASCPIASTTTGMPRAHLPPCTRAARRGVGQTWILAEIDRMAALIGPGIRARTSPPPSPAGATS